MATELVVTTTPEVECLDGQLDLTPVAIGDLILVEVLQGFCNDHDLARTRQLRAC